MNVIISAIGTASHIPSTPITLGSKIIEAEIKANVLKNDITAEIIPFDNAVKRPDAKMFIPANTKFIKNIPKPS